MDDAWRRRVEYVGLDCPSFSSTLAAHCHRPRRGDAAGGRPCPASTRDIGTDCYYYSQDRGTTFRDEYYENAKHYGKDDYYKDKPERFSTTTESKKNKAYSRTRARTRRTRIGGTIGRGVSVKKVTATQLASTRRLPLREVQQNDAASWHFKVRLGGCEDVLERQLRPQAQRQDDVREGAW